MFCKQCGTNNDSGARYCKACGLPLDIEMVDTTKQKRNVKSKSKPKSLSRHPVLREVKNMGTSPLFIVATVLFTLSILFALIYASQGGTGKMLGLLYQYAGKIGKEDWVYPLLRRPVNRSADMLFSLISRVPAVVTAVGLWMILGASANGKYDGMQTGGFTVLKVITVIQLIEICVVTAISGIALTVGTVTLLHINYYEWAECIPMFIGIGIIALIFVFAILYYAKLLKTVVTVRRTVRTGEPSKKVSVFVALVLLIFGGFELVLALASVVLGVFPMLMGATSAASEICFGVLLFHYRDRMKCLLNQSK